MIEVRITKKMGRGLFATEDIKFDDVIHQAEFVKILNSEINSCETIAKYVFEYTKKYCALCLGMGSLFNHSDNPNAQAWFTKKAADGRQVMEFVALRGIKAGEQIFICYGGEEYAYYHLLKKHD